jgi:hypothetical protein
MKYLIAALVFFVSGFVANAQTNLRTVMTDTNGVVQRPTNFIVTNRIVSVTTNGTVANPTNFWTANSNSINAVVTNAATSDWTLANFSSFDWVNIRDSEVESNNITLFTAGSAIQLRVVATNSSGTGALKMSRFPNYSPSTGSGIRWNITNSFFVRITASPSTNGDIVRFLLGNPQGGLSNFVAPLTNNGVGFEVTNNSGTNQIRLIAHNGSTNIETAWVNTPTVTGRLNVGVVSSVGIVTLYQSANSAALALVTNISITNGPTNAAGGDSGTFAGGIIATNTNSIARDLYIFDALLRATE